MEELCALTQNLNFDLAQVVPDSSDVIVFRTLLVVRYKCNFDSSALIGLKIAIQLHILVIRIQIEAFKVSFILDLPKFLTTISSRRSKLIEIFSLTFLQTDSSASFILVYVSGYEIRMPRVQSGV